MDNKNALKFYVYMFFALFFLMMTVVVGYILVTIKFYLPIFALDILFLFLTILFIYLLIRNFKSDNEKKHLYFYLKYMALMFICMVIFTIACIKTDDKMIRFISIMIPSFIISLFMSKESRKNTLFVDTSKLCFTYKNIRLFESKYCTENVKIGDTIVSPSLPNKNLWKMKSTEDKVVGYMFRPDIMEDFKNRHIAGVHTFTVSRIDTEGNIFIDDNVYRPTLNFSKKKEFSSNKPSPFILNSSSNPSESITYWVPVLDDKNNMNKCTFQNKQLKLNKTFENVKILDADISATVSENEILQFCYDENNTILLLSTLNTSPIGHITDDNIVSLIKSFDDSNDSIIISVQKIEKDDNGKLDLYVRILLYK